MLMNRFLCGPGNGSGGRHSELSHERRGSRVCFCGYIVPNTSSLPVGRLSKWLQPRKVQTGSDGDSDRQAGRQAGKQAGAGR